MIPWDIYIYMNIIYICTKYIYVHNIYIWIWIWIYNDILCIYGMNIHKCSRNFDVKTRGFHGSLMAQVVMAYALEQVAEAAE
jgi:hypothetical protein